MRCGTRALSLTSLGFGLVATGALSLAVATDYWLFTVELIYPDADDVIGSNDTTYEDEEVDPNVSGPTPSELPPVVGADGFVISMHSGLWRLCIINEPSPGAYIDIYLPFNCVQ